MVFARGTKEEEATEQARRFPTKLSSETDRQVVWGERKEGKGRDLFILQAPRDHSPEPVQRLLQELTTKLPLEAMELGFVQLLPIKEGELMVVTFKSRIISRFH